VVEDTPRSLERQYRDLVTVRSCRGEPDDDELAVLAPVLRSLARHPHVRTLAKRDWKTRFGAEDAR
jgi:hypothetical protein